MPRREGGMSGADVLGQSPCPQNRMPRATAGAGPLPPQGVAQPNARHYCAHCPMLAEFTERVPVGSERRAFHQNTGTPHPDVNPDAHSRPRQKGPEFANQIGSVCSDRRPWDKKLSLCFSSASPANDQFALAPWAGWSTS